MEVRIGLAFLFVVVASWACDARQLEDPNLSSDKVNTTSVTQINYWEQGLEVRKQASSNENVCTLCEEITSQTLDYLNEDKTQTEIIDLLHHSCSKLHSFKQQCITLVDYYASLFFLEVSSIQPGQFCSKVNLCQQISMISSKVQADSCELCHYTVSELLLKLKDPDTEIDIVAKFLKVCNALKKYKKKCKRIVFEFGPLLLANAEKFLESTDICTVIHACKASTVIGKEKISLVSDS
ncbi:saposin B domain-containing protein [Quillaja saponaria]|nr:saposin B domain-containing protein [Quillaja saponaria]